MRKVGCAVLGTMILALILAMGPPAFAQEDEKPKQDEKAAQDDKSAHEDRTAQDEKHPDEKQNEGKEAQTEEKQRRDEKSQETTTQQRETETHSSQRIPEAKFRANFGREHVFVINRPVIVAGVPRFQYGGYWFVFVQPWPTGWAYTDQVYVDFIDGGYYLLSPVHPGIQISINVVM